MVVFSPKKCGTKYLIFCIQLLHFIMCSPKRLRRERLHTTSKFYCVFSPKNCRTKDYAQLLHFITCSPKTIVAPKITFNWWRVLFKNGSAKYCIQLLNLVLFLSKTCSTKNCTQLVHFMACSSRKFQRERLETNGRLSLRACLHGGRVPRLSGLPG